jgi:hypothetical protein
MAIPGSPCLCGGTYKRAARYEATQTVDVLICWTCGREDPPLYQRPASVYDISQKHCNGCDQWKARSEFDFKRSGVVWLQAKCTACYGQMKRGRRAAS